jgi:hypothetical protein
LCNLYLFLVKTTKLCTNFHILVAYCSADRISLECKQLGDSLAAKLSALD